MHDGVVFCLHVRGLWKRAFLVLDCSWFTVVTSARGVEGSACY